MSVQVSTATGSPPNAMSVGPGSLSAVARLGSNPPRIHVTVSRAWNAPSDVRVGYCARRSRASSRRIGRRATGGPRCALGIRRGRGRCPRGGGRCPVVRSREALRRARSDRSRSLPCTPQLTVARGHRRSDSLEQPTRSGLYPALLAQVDEDGLAAGRAGKQHFGEEVRAALGVSFVDPSPMALVESAAERAEVVARAVGPREGNC